MSSCELFVFLINKIILIGVHKCIYTLLSVRFTVYIMGTYIIKQNVYLTLVERKYKLEYMIL